MTDAPERIWVFLNPGSYRYLSWGTFHSLEHETAPEYVRADLVPAMLAEERAALVAQGRREGLEAAAGVVAQMNGADFFGRHIDSDKNAPAIFQDMPGLADILRGILDLQARDAAATLRALIGDADA